MRNNGGKYNLSKKQIAQDYTDGHSISTLAEKYDVCERTICNYLEKASVPRNNIYHNLSLNRDYFEVIDSYDKAYFLGFFYADGYVGYNTNDITLQLKADDDQILKVFAGKIQTENPICYSKRNEAQVSFKSKKIKDDLAKYNIVPRKTHIATLPTIDEKYESHFIRGLFDGDGWISAKSQQIGFCGNEATVTILKNILVEKLNVYNVKVLHTGKHLWQITWSSKNDIKTIGEYIYKNKQDCYLERKYLNYIKIIS